MKKVWILYWNYGDRSALEISFVFEDAEKARGLHDILVRYDTSREWRCLEMQVTS